MTLLRMMTLSAALIAASSVAAAAGERPYAPHQSCASLERLVKAEGAVLIDTSPTAFDRFVNSQQFCLYGQETVAAWVHAGDDRECFVGYTCKEHDRERSR